MSMITSFFSSLWVFLKWPLYIIGAVVGLFSLLVLFNVIWLRCVKKYPVKRGEHYRVKPISLLKRVFFLAPRRYALDLVIREPEAFRHQGLIMFCGRQGSGKTIALVHQSIRFQSEYPKSIVIGNLKYKYQSAELMHWKQLIEFNNPLGKEKGVIVQIDEMQNWFSSNMGKNFPPEMLTVITQNRKNRRVILGTSQVFKRVSKAIREQTTEVRFCYTFFGCITFVRRAEPELNEDGDVKKYKHRGMYFFVHDDQLREAYNTWHVISSLSDADFPEQKLNCLEVTVKTHK